MQKEPKGRRLHPALTCFEEDAAGKDIAEFVVDRCLAAGFQGVAPLNTELARPRATG
ncbi:hypothetical protein ACFY0F_09285 [Streptomyces sp. NPDC001544]|uniref:hypothetical protein n=1 Tax=Streptomyces sp. NPDC001544 TaxID=3364584 RepID=UPI00367FD7BE